MHAGPAQTTADVAAALQLATDIFHAQEHPMEAALRNKTLLMSAFGGVAEQDVIVLKDSSGRIGGTCFLVDRQFYTRRGSVKGTFLTAIGVAQPLRGAGLSKLLMSAAIEECERRAAGFSILIARRAVDYYYNQFSFWGLSQYSTLSLKLPRPQATASNYATVSACAADLPAIADLHSAVYAGLYGSCERPPQYWQHVLWRTGWQQRSFVVFRTPHRIEGYAIFEGKLVYEFAALDGVSGLQMLAQLGRQLGAAELSVKCSREHPLVRELQGLDFSITQRQCLYGGHMVRIINPKVLREHIEAGDAAPVDSLPSGYENTCRLMGAECLSSAPPQLVSPAPRPFNVLLLDEA